MSGTNQTPSVETIVQAAATALPVRLPRAEHREGLAEGAAISTAPASDYDVAAALFALDRAASAVDLQDLPELIGRLVSVEERARLRLREGASFKGSTRPGDENISAATAAQRLGVSKYWLYRNARRLPFAHRIGRRVVFSTQGLERWNRQRATR